MSTCFGHLVFGPFNNDRCLFTHLSCLAVAAGASLFKFVFPGRGVLKTEQRSAGYTSEPQAARPWSEVSELSGWQPQERWQSHGAGSEGREGAPPSRSCIHCRASIDFHHLQKFRDEDVTRGGFEWSQKDFKVFFLTDNFSLPTCASESCQHLGLADLWLVNNVSDFSLTTIAKEHRQSGLLSTTIYFLWFWRLRSSRWSTTDALSDELASWFTDGAFQLYLYLQKGQGRCQGSLL